MVSAGAQQAGRLVAAAEAFLADPSLLGKGRPNMAGLPDRRASHLQVRTASASDLVRVDRAVRRVDTTSFPMWAACRPEAMLTDGPAGHPPLLEALAMHPNGRVRAAVVEVFASEPDRHLAALAVRCLDPVAAVRGRADVGTRAALGTVEVREIIALDALLLGEQMRRLAPDVTSATEEALLADPRATLEHLGWRSERTASLLAACPVVRTADLLACWDGRGPAPRSLFQLGVRRATPQDVEWFLRDRRRWLPPDQLVWLHAAARWPGLDEVALSAPLLRRLQRCPLGQLRHLVADAQRGSTPEDEVLRALLDARAAPRRMAQRLLQHAGLSVDAYYRALLDMTPTAVVGLGEVGERADAALVAPLARSERAAVRHAAVNALKLDPDHYLEVLVAALGDPDRRVARAAAWRLRRRVEVVGVDRLFEIGGRPPGPSARAQAVYLLMMLPRGRFLSELLGDRRRAEAHRSFVSEALQQWRRQALRGPVDRGRAGGDVLAEMRARYADEPSIGALLDLDTSTEGEAPSSGLFAIGEAAWRERLARDATP